MKKRLASILLSAALSITAVPQFVLATPAYDVAEMETAQTVLDELKEDAAATPEAIYLRNSQETIMKDGVNSFSNIDFTYSESGTWEPYVDKVYTTDAATKARVKKYMQLRYLADKNLSTDAKNQLDDLDEDYDTAGQTLVESNTDFENYRVKVNQLYEDFKAAHPDFFNGDELKNVTDADFELYVKQCLVSSTKVLLWSAFSSQGVGEDNYSFSHNYFTNFRESDINKKNAAVFFGAGITSELAHGNIFTNVKNNIKDDFKNDIAKVFVSDKDDAIKAAYDAMGKMLVAAYPEGNVNHNDVVRIFGDGNKQGAIELAMDVVDPEHKVQNIWLNLFLRYFVQMKTAAGEFETITATTNTAKSIENSMTGSFVLQNTSATLSLPTNYFTVKTDSSFVTYNNGNGKFYVSNNSAIEVGDTYSAKITLYRSPDATDGDVNTFIEQYNVTVTNPNVPSGGGGGGVQKVPVVIETPPEGGSIEGSTSVKYGSSQKYTVKPKPGFVVDKVFVDGVEVKDYVVDDNNNIIVTIDSITTQHKVTANFVKLLTEDAHISYIIGYPDGDFKPAGNISREETATIFFRLLTSEAREKYLSSTTSFDDVEDGRWSLTAIGTLAKMNVISGYEDGSFRPSNKITRAEFATIAYRFYNMSYSGADLFNDIANHWAKSYINAIADAKWIEGYENGEYKPDQAITRAEAVTIVNRMLSRFVNAENVSEDSVSFNDCKATDWFYTAVMEASNSHEFEETRLEDGTEKWTAITENPDWISYEK